MTSLIAFSLVPRPRTPHERVGSGDETKSRCHLAGRIYIHVLATRLPLDGCGRAAETAKQSENAEAQLETVQVTM